MPLSKRLGAGAELREEVGHLERGADGFGALVRPGHRLLQRVHGEDAECDRHAGLERGELEPGGGLAGDVVEVGRLAPDHAAERDDAGVAARLRERHRAEGKLERARDGHDRDELAADAGALELGDGGLEQLVRDVAVEACRDDADAAAAAERRAFEHRDAVGDVEVAGGVAREPKHRLGLRLRRSLGVGRRRVLDVEVVVVRVVAVVVLDLVRILVVVELRIVEVLGVLGDRRLARDDDVLDRGLVDGNLACCSALLSRPVLARAHSSSGSNFRP